MVLAGKMVPAGVLGGRIRGQHGLPALRHRQLQDLGRGCCLLPDAAWIETGGDRNGAANGIHQPGHGLPRAPQLVVRFPNPLASGSWAVGEPDYLPTSFLSAVL